MKDFDRLARRRIGELFARLQDAGYSPGLARVLGLFVFIGLAVVAEALLSFQIRDAESEGRLAALGYASTLRARVDRELNAVLYLTSGLSSYLVVRNRQIDAGELQHMLAVLYRTGRHVRNFGIAVGYRLTYVYPLQGNQSAVGLEYTQLPSQWPAVQRAIENGKGTLAGPVKLVQGGAGFVYRAPVFVEGRYWGLLSTVIDSDSFFAGAFDEVLSDRYDFAIRGRDGEGAKGEMIRGDRQLFDDPRSVMLESDVPNGHWLFAVRPRQASADSPTIWIMRGLGWLLAALLGASVTAVFGHRGELARLATVDGLTGLPNRRLLGDRLGHALLRHARRDGNHCAVVFIDLDGFKAINDLYGHQVGDLVLRSAALRIAEAVRLGDTVARWGGDEFVIVAEDSDRTSVDALVARLRQAVAAPLNTESGDLAIAASLGVALYPEDGSDADALLAVADLRMYEDKLRRKGA